MSGVAASSVELLGAADIRELAAKLGVVPTKKLGQNFVTDPNTIRRIVAAAKLDGTETVVEIGRASCRERVCQYV